MLICETDKGVEGGYVRAIVNDSAGSTSDEPPGALEDAGGPSGAAKPADPRGCHRYVVVDNERSVSGPIGRPAAVVSCTAQARRGSRFTSITAIRPSGRSVV